MNSTRRAAVVAGVLFLITEVAAIGGRVLYGPLLGNPDYIVSAGVDNQVFLGALFEVILAVACVGTGVVLYPIVKRQNESLALGYLSARVLEAAAILVGVISVLSVVTLRQNLDGEAADASATAVGAALLAIHAWTFWMGPGIALGIGTLLLASLMYSSGLVPRAVAWLGFIGGSLILLSSIAVLFGVYDQDGTVGLVVALPVFAWEVSLAIWLISKGFKASTIMERPTSSTG
jgi:hypothetical protein